MEDIENRSLNVMTIQLKTLVLNADYSPINLMPIQSIPCEDAITRVFNETCHIVAEYDRLIKTPNPNFRIKWPSVIARNKMEGLGDKTVALQRESLYYRDHAVCAYCGREVELREATMDHVIPKSLGGENSWTNATLACPRCNHTKSNSLPGDKWKPKHKLYEPNYYQLLHARRHFPIVIPDISWKDYIGEWYAPVIIKSEARLSA